MLKCPNTLNKDHKWPYIYNMNDNGIGRKEPYAVETAQPHNLIVNIYSADTKD